MSNKKFSAANVKLEVIDGIADRVETVEAMSKFNLKEIPLDKIKLSEKNLFGIRDIDELAESIKEHGLLHNVVVRKIEDENYDYEMISGERRWHAFKRLDRKTIPAKIEESDDVDSEMKLIVANLRTRELNDMEKSQSVMRLAELIKIRKKEGEDFGGKKTREIIAEEFKMSPAQVQKFIKIQELIPEFKEMVANGTIGLEAANQYAQLPDDTQKMICDAIKQGLNLSTKEAKDLKEKLKKSEEDKAKVIQEMQGKLDSKEFELKRAADEIKKNKDEIDKIKKDADLKIASVQDKLDSAMEDIDLQKKEAKKREDEIREQIKSQIEANKNNDPEAENKIKELEEELRKVKEESVDKINELEEVVNDLQTERKEIVDDYEEKLKANKIKEVDIENVTMNAEITALCKQAQRLLSSVVGKVASCKAKKGFVLSDETKKALSDITKYGEVLE